ncbi:MAG: nitroreductase family protein [Bacteroidales bacterium]|jgi:nitroreductase|nr:nitroreductase family protein [Bacteroidales bacterium]MDY0196821.1 nitroreductase family protein [Tenuifilaceae bacterium]
MKSFLDIAKKRYSCRSYDSREIPKGVLLDVLESARIAPSATNAQPRQFVVVSTEPLRGQIISCYSGLWLASAPAIIVACGNYSESWHRADGKDHCDIDMAIAIDHITLAAADNDLATCWVCKFDVLKCASILQLPKNIAPIALIPIGYPSENGNYSERHLLRKPIDEIVSWEGYNF